MPLSPAKHVSKHPEKSFVTQGPPFRGVGALLRPEDSLEEEKLCPSCLMVLTPRRICQGCARTTTSPLTIGRLRELGLSS